VRQISEQKYRGLPGTVRDCRGLRVMAEECHGTVGNCESLRETEGDRGRVRWDYRGLQGTTGTTLAGDYRGTTGGLQGGLQGTI